jgi:hypothetical protein
MFEFLAQSTYYEASKVLSTFKRKPGAGAVGCLHVWDVWDVWDVWVLKRTD